MQYVHRYQYVINLHLFYCTKEFEINVHFKSNQLAFQNFGYVAFMKQVNRQLNVKGIHSS